MVSEISGKINCNWWVQGEDVETSEDAFEFKDTPISSNKAAGVGIMGVY